MATKTKAAKSNKAATSATKTAAEKGANEDAEKQVNTGSVTKSKTDRPDVEPKDPAPGKPKVDESVPDEQKLASGGSDVYMGSTPLVRGIPVVVPINDSMKVEAETVLGVAVAAAVISGAPEMVSNAQAEYAVEHQDWKTGDIKSIHVNQGELQVDVIQDDGSVKTERHRADNKTVDEFQKSFEDPKNARKNSNAFFKKHFNKETRIEDQA